MFHSSASLLFLLSLVQHCTHGSPIHRRSAHSAVITTNFMDPSVIELNGGYYAFSGPNGNPAGINVQVASSPNFSTWTLQAGFDALPNPGPWAASPANVWAPDINQLVHQHGKLYLLLLHCYYTANSISNRTTAHLSCITLPPTPHRLLTTASASPSPKPSSVLTLRPPPHFSVPS